MSDFTNRIDSVLAERKLRRADLSRGAEVPEGTIRNWIRGTTPPVDVAYKVAKFLGVSLEWLVSGVDGDEKIILNDEEIEIIQKYRKLDSRDKNAVATLNSALESQYTEHLNPVQNVAKV